MRAYQLPDKEWIDLDHVQAISNWWCSPTGKFSFYFKCDLTMAFQKEPKRITLASYSDYGIYGEARKELDEETRKTADAHYRNLLAAWKFV